MPFLASTLCVSLALAEPLEPPANELQQTASALVQKVLIEPLNNIGKKRHRFSRAAPVPVQRRVRVLDATAQTDARGQRFVRFAIDVRQAWDDDESDSWRKNAIVGCAYPADGTVFVQNKAAYFPAKSALGASAAPQPDVCQLAPAPS